MKNNSKKKDPLVSIITPCYNEEKNIHRFIDSIIAQTYTNIELIIINDGSRDNTEKIIKSYENAFQKKGINFIYIYQKNSGLGSAINTGLKVFTGEYLCWPDSDDFFEPTSIEKRVSFLEKNKEYGIVSSDANVLHEENMDLVIAKIFDGYRNKFETDHFEYLIEKKSVFCSGCHMVRSSAFLDVNPKRRIYPAKRGQNFQMLLPIYYKYKRGYIDEPLYNYVIYNNSMSSGDETLDEKLSRIYEHKTIVSHTLKNMNMTDSDRKNALNILDKSFSIEKYKILVKFGDIDSLTDQFEYLKKNKWLTFRSKILFLERTNKCVKRIIGFLRNCRGKYDR